MIVSVRGKLYYTAISLLFGFIYNKFLVLFIRENFSRIPSEYISLSVLVMPALICALVLFLIIFFESGVSKKNIQFGAIFILYIYGIFLYWIGGVTYMLLECVSQQECF
jgi:fatty acid desaturase